MSEKLPYFKFFTGEWANGSISIEKLSVQGLFINVCCFYWSKQGIVSIKQIEKKFKAKKELLVLIDEGILKSEDGFVTIDFLDNQMVERDSRIESARKAGKASAQKRAKRKLEEPEEDSTSVEIPLNETPTIKIREEEEKIRIRKEEELKGTELFNRFWLLYSKNVNKEKCFKKFLTLKNEELEILFVHVPEYVNSTPDKKFRKAPLVYLNNKSFNDEIIISNGHNGKQEPTFNDKFFKGSTDVC